MRRCVPILGILVIETITFRLADGATEDAFLAADARVQIDFAYQQYGILRRTTARGPDGEWLVVVFWHSEDDAENAARSFADHPATKDFRAAVDRSTYAIRRYVTLD
jgi:hypothetical protein